jgi:hypothetical protein
MKGILCSILLIWRLGADRGIVARFEQVLIEMVFGFVKIDV